MFSAQNSQISGGATYIDDVFSTYLYTGNGSTQTITNGIDLSTKGGLVWIKNRTQAVSHTLYDTIRGGDRRLFSNYTDAEQVTSPPDDSLTFNNDGFSAGAGSTGTSNIPYASWTFAKQAKFFDVVTYTGTGSARTVAHNLGSVPGTIIVKRTDATEGWFIYHRSTGAAEYLTFNTSSSSSSTTIWNNTSPTSSVFSLGATTAVNANGGTYVAYLFAHNAGGFGTAGTDNVISCGSFTTDGSGNATVNLGYEPQWIFRKITNSTGNWFCQDVMRGSTTDGNTQILNFNNANAEGSDSNQMRINSTGFTVSGFGASNTFIYIAIRRPMKPPTTGTEVFSPIISNSAQDTKLTTNFVVDAQLLGWRTNTSSGNWTMYDRLRGVSSNTSGGAFPRLITSGSATEDTSGGVNGWDNTGFRTSGAYASINAWYANFRRAPGFFDVVCYTGKGTTKQNISHNLTVAPELMIVKSRSQVYDYGVYCQSLGANKHLILNGTYASLTDTDIWDNTNPTASTFRVGNSNYSNNSGTTYVAYLFATVAGVSKVGSYTGTGTTQTINCGFSGGARFVMVKATSTTGDWIVVDTARGLVSGNDPTLALNSTAAEVTTNDWFDPYSAGFELSSASGNLANTNGVSYIYMAIA